MTITEIKEKLESSTHPVARALHQGSDFKVIVLGFKKGMILKEHKTHIPSKLTVLEGSVVYRENDSTVTLHQYDEQVIPVEVIHMVEAIEDSLCLLTQGA